MYTNEFSHVLFFYLHTSNAICRCTRTTYPMGYTSWEEAYGDKLRSITHILEDKRNKPEDELQSFLKNKVILTKLSGETNYVVNELTNKNMNNHNKASIMIKILKNVQHVDKKFKSSQ